MILKKMNNNAISTTNMNFADKIDKTPIIGSLHSEKSLKSTYIIAHDPSN